MPYRAPRPCNYPGCPATVLSGGYCDKHKGKARANPERQRFEEGRAWRKIRASYLSRYPLCHDCETEGRVTLAEEVHHLIDHEHNQDKDLMSLCKMHHSKRTRG